jgi:hypothetical protein
MRWICSFIAVLIIAGTVSAQDVSVPHTFQAGTPARASEVNENFAALVDAINEPEASSPPGVARVEISGGDYSNPVDALNDLDSWCRWQEPSAENPQGDDPCQLLIGAGSFDVSRTLEADVDLDIRGAGAYGSNRTELIAMSGITFCVIDFYNTNNTVSDLAVTIPDNSSAIGICGPNNELGRLTIERVVVEAGGASPSGIGGGPFIRLKDVDVTIRQGEGTDAIGISSNCAEADRVNVRVERQSGTATGWRDSSDGCSFTVSNFSVSVYGGTAALGVAVSGDGGASLADGDIEVRASDSTASRVGIRQSLVDDGGASYVRVQVHAGTGIEFRGTRLTMNESFISGNEGAGLVVMDRGDNSLLFNFSVAIQDSTLVGNAYGIELRSAPNLSLEPEIKVDRSTVSGTTNSILGRADFAVKLGASKLVGPIDAGGSALTCVFVYDEAYAPIACP